MTANHEQTFSTSLTSTNIVFSPNGFRTPWKLAHMGAFTTPSVVIRALISSPLLAPSLLHSPQHDGLHVDLLVSDMRCGPIFDAHTHTDASNHRQLLDPSTRFSEAQMNGGYYGHITWANAPESRKAYLNDTIDIGYTGPSTTIGEVMSTTDGQLCYFYSQ